MSSRQFLVGGNWKMNGSKSLCDTLVTALNQGKWNKDKTQVVIAPPSPYLSMVREKLVKDVGVSAQNVNEKESGAFTGEVSYTMCKDLNVNWVILGHSERREIFKESDDLIAKKTLACLNASLSVIFCCGEKLEEREANETLNVVTRQIGELVKVLGSNQNLWAKVVIAYEPVWAIGTGKVATPQQAQQVHAEIRKYLSDKVSPKVASSTRILYGGSVNAGNAATLAKEVDIDGFLVGGASLKAADFLTICASND